MNALKIQKLILGADRIAAGGRGGWGLGDDCKKKSQKQLNGKVNTKSIQNLPPTSIALLLATVKYKYNIQELYGWLDLSKLKKSISFQLHFCSFSFIA